MAAPEIPTAASLRQLQCDKYLADKPDFKQNLIDLLNTTFAVNGKEALEMNLGHAPKSEQLRAATTIWWLLEPRGFIVKHFFGPGGNLRVWVSLEPAPTA
jgi:hypothetical protein